MTIGTQTIVANFVQGLGKSDWWSVTREYTGSNGAVSGDITLAGTFTDSYSMGKELKSSFLGGTDIEKVVENAIKVQKWPRDEEKGVYVVFTSADVMESSSNGNFCKDYCGYHGMNQKLKIAMIGDGTRCPGGLPPPGKEKGTPGCVQRYYRNQTDPAYSINQNVAADTMVDVLAHELSETATDYANAWRDSAGFEDGDKCSTYFIDVKGVGATSPYNGAYNTVFPNGGKYLLQSMWSAKQQKCILASGGSTSGVSIKSLV